MNPPDWKLTLVERWWNGSMGRFNRRDIWLYRDHSGAYWRVVARQGNGDAREWSRDFLAEHAARQLVADMLRRSGDQWRQLRV